MLNSLTQLFSMPQSGDSFKIPKSAQDTIPVSRIYADGIFYANNQYSKSWRFQDINYSVASPEAQEAMYKTYCALINSYDTDAATKITINNRRLDDSTLKSTIYMPYKEDGLDRYRSEYNDMIYNQTAGSHATIQEKYITVSVTRRSIEEARTFFKRIATDIEKGFAALGTKAVQLTLNERLEILHDFNREGDSSFHFDLTAAQQRGHNFKDNICPEVIEFKGSYFQIGERFGRVLFLADYASYIKDSMITELCDLDRQMMLSIDMLPMQTTEAVKLIQKQLLSIDTDRARFQDKQNRAGNYSAHLPYDMEQALSEATEYMTDVTQRDQRVIYAYVTIVHLADSLKELDSDTEQIIAIGQQKMCRFTTLKYRQENGLNTVLPYGGLRFGKGEMRTLTTESTGILLPFKVQEIFDSGGIYYGQNAVSKSPIVCDRIALQNPHSWILGVSGSGKSLQAKMGITIIALMTDEDIQIVDPDGEYTPLVEALGGTVFDLSPSSKHRINALALNQNYGDEEADPIVYKSEFVLSLVEQMYEGERLGAKEKSIIDRCLMRTYSDYIKDYTGEPPTLRDFHSVLLAQEEPEAREIALAIERFTQGTLSIFSYQSNIDLSGRITSYNLKNLGKQLLSPGMNVALDNILNKVSYNRGTGRATHVICDEMHMFFKNPYSAQFFENAWKRFRKYNAFLQGITQNISEALDNEHARLMIANSEFIILLNQAAQDREKLAELLSISDTQLDHITNSQAGHGLMRIGSNLIPFINDFPKNTELYRLLSTKPNEK